MTSFIHVAPDGRICGFGSVPQGGIIFPLDGCETIEGVIAAPEAAYWDFEAQSLAPISPQPTAFHAWDWPTKQWIPNLDAGRTGRIQQITRELSTRLYLPCNGFDADKVSRERISGMIARLQRGDGLPAGWVGWRDASNQQQWATDDAATVLANLTALSRAIEDREQALLVASWTHKANIAALEDIDAILAYDVTTGW